MTFSWLLSLYANEACIVAGRVLVKHAYTIKVGLEDDTSVGNAIITMYAEFGIVKDAYEIFTRRNRDLECHDFCIRPSW